MKNNNVCSNVKKSEESSSSDNVFCKDEFKTIQCGSGTGTGTDWYWYWYCHLKIQ